MPEENHFRGGSASFFGSRILTPEFYPLR